LPLFERELRLPQSAEEVHAWHLREGAFERLTPPGSGVTIVDGHGAVTEGDVRTLSVPVVGCLRRRWVARHRDFVPGRRFVDEQVEGPFASWVHEHLFEPDAEGGCVHRDRIRYREPLGLVGALLAGGRIRAQLDELFAFRHRRLARDLARHATFADRPRLSVAVSGASGLVGRQLCAFLSTGGHVVKRLVRRPARDDAEIAWDPASGRVDAAALEGVDAVVHLAGENVAAGRWTASRKERIRSSRVQGTRALAQALASCDGGPRVLVSASAVGYYGLAGEAEVDEASPSGGGFLASVCRDWEAAAEPAREAGLRVVHPRIGLVLSADGGALARMLPAFRLGLGGRIGSGRQWMSWIALDDLVGLIHHALFDESWSGPVNAVSPAPTRNAEFTRVLARVLRRPSVLPAPAAALRLALGEMARELLLGGSLVRSIVLPGSGFRFLLPELEGALRFELLAGE
jgi:uncharacterized protein (TIGR01777 family)